MLSLALSPQPFVSLAFPLLRLTLAPQRSVGHNTLSITHGLDDNLADIHVASDHEHLQRALLHTNEAASSDRDGIPKPASIRTVSAFHLSNLRKPQGRSVRLYMIGSTIGTTTVALGHELQLGRGLSICWES